MPLTLEVPDDLAASLEASWWDLSKETLKALAVEAYFRDDLSAEEVQRLLNLSLDETDALLQWSDRAEQAADEPTAVRVVRDLAGSCWLTSTRGHAKSAYARPRCYQSRSEKFTFL